MITIDNSELYVFLIDSTAISLFSLPQRKRGRKQKEKGQ
jgi:hypothetical protein